MFTRHSCAICSYKYLMFNSHDIPKKLYELSVQTFFWTEDRLYLTIKHFGGWRHLEFLIIKPFIVHQQCSTFQ